MSHVNILPMNSVSVIKKLPIMCHSILSSRRSLPRHIIIIDGNPITYKCTVCCKTFKSKSNCCYHKHCANDAAKPYSCATCSRKFATKTHRDYHQLIHTGENPFKCSQCSKSFKTKSKRDRHQDVHSETRKNYSCDICGKLFLRQTSIKVHKRSHTGEKPYSCSLCSKSYTEKKNLIHHINSHNQIKNWICESCGISFSIKWNLELHRRTHTRTRAFNCSEADCQSSFSQKRYLKRHMETHKNAVKYVCSICEKVFSRKDNLQRHIGNTHLEQQSNNTKPERTDELHIQTTNSGSIQKCRSPSTMKDSSLVNTDCPDKDGKQVQDNATMLLNKDSCSFEQSIPVRTESVIKSSRKIDGNNRISVIKCVRKEFDTSVSQYMLPETNNSFEHFQEEFMNNVPGTVETCYQNEHIGNHINSESLTLQNSQPEFRLHDSHILNNDKILLKDIPQLHSCGNYNQMTNDCEHEEITNNAFNMCSIENDSPRNFTSNITTNSLNSQNLSFKQVVFSSYKEYPNEDGNRMSNQNNRNSNIFWFGEQQQTTPVHADFDNSNLLDLSMKTQ